MRNARAIVALLLAMSPPSAMAGNEARMSATNK
jgi:hypothetical protein